MGVVRGTLPASRRFGMRRMTRTRLVGAVLLALALRSLIPLGFMPAADGTLSLMICPAGLPPGFLDAGRSAAMPAGMAMPAHPGHGPGAVDDGHCIFCTGFGAAPPALLAALLLLLVAGIAIVTLTIPPPSGMRLVHLPQARAPPAPR